MTYCFVGLRPLVFYSHHGRDYPVETKGIQSCPVPKDDLLSFASVLKDCSQALSPRQQSRPYSCGSCWGRLPCVRDRLSMAVGQWHSWTSFCWVHGRSGLAEKGRPLNLMSHCAEQVHLAALCSLDVFHFEGDDHPAKQSLAQSLVLPPPRPCRHDASYRLQQ